MKQKKDEGEFSIEEIESPKAEKAEKRGRKERFQSWLQRPSKSERLGKIKTELNKRRLAKERKKKIGQQRRMMARMEALEEKYRTDAVQREIRNAENMARMEERMKLQLKQERNRKRQRSDDSSGSDNEKDTYTSIDDGLCKKEKDTQNDAELSKLPRHKRALNTNPTVQIEILKSMDVKESMLQWEMSCNDACKQLNIYKTFNVLSYLPVKGESQESKDKRKQEAKEMEESIQTHPRALQALMSLKIAIKKSISSVNGGTTAQHVDVAISEKQMPDDPQSIFRYIIEKSISLDTTAAARHLRQFNESSWKKTKGSLSLWHDDLIIMSSRLGAEFTQLHRYKTIREKLLSNISRSASERIKASLITFMLHKGDSESGGKDGDYSNKRLVETINTITEEEGCSPNGERQCSVYSVLIKETKATNSDPHAAYFTGSKKKNDNVSDQSIDRRARKNKNKRIKLQSIKANARAYIALGNNSGGSNNNNINNNNINNNNYNNNPQAPPPPPPIPNNQSTYYGNPNNYNKNYNKQNDYQKPKTMWCRKCEAHFKALGIYDSKIPAISSHNDAQCKRVPRGPDKGKGKGKQNQNANYVKKPWNKEKDKNSTWQPKGKGKQNKGKGKRKKGT